MSVVEDGLKTGTKLFGDKYIIEKAIGQGGFGITYKAKANQVVQGSIGRMEVQIDVAIKEFFIKSECERNGTTVSVPTKKKLDFVDSYKKKFLKEATNISKLQHNNIVKVIDVFEENDTVYYVMQFIDGVSLEDKIRKEGPMSEQEAEAVINQLASALDYIHKRRLTHLDIKPANILIDKSGCLKLIDFGLSKHYDKSGNATSTGTSQGVSEGFSPVEQYSYGGVNEFSPQTDIYSVGATLAYLLTGNVPAKATEQVLPQLPDSISEKVRLAIYAAMQPRKNDRPKDIEEFLFFLKGVKKPKSNIGNTQPNREDESSTEIVSGYSSSRKTFSWQKIAIIAGVAAVVGVILAFSLGKSKSAKEEVVVVDSVAVVEKKEPIDSALNIRHKNSKGVVFTYTGEVRNEIPHGKGIGKYEAGTYTGEYEEGLRHGEGEFITSDGLNKFKGKFEKDLYSKGRLTLVSDGFYYEGTFKDGNMWNGVWYNKKGKVDAKVVNGVERR